MPMDISEDMHSTMIDSSQVHGTFHLQVSIESVPMPPQSPTSPSPALSLPPPPTPPSPALSLPPPLTPPSPTALQLPQNWTFPPTPSPLGPSPPSPLSSGFDISRHGSADTTMYIEQSLDERPMSQTILEDAGEITYDVIKEGIIRKKPKLVTSDGHSYVIKVPGKKTTYWRCCVRRKGNHCGATVAQRDNVFIPGSAPHTHPGDLLVAKKPILARDAKQEAVRHIELRPTMFADEAMTSLFGSKDSRIPKTKSVIRKMHRAREGVLPKQPKNLDFEFDDEFLKEPFLVGDVHVTGERHMMFATQTQLDLLTKARKWYLDGTFKAVHLPFVQLWSIHAFIREGDNMKQVPLMYMLTTRRRKQDYVAILQKVLDILEEAPAVECFTMDFEIALWHALREVFPSSKLKGCAFHWSQAVQKHIGEFGLARTYRERQSLHSLIRKLLALPFLPAADIKRAFRKLKEQADDCNEQVQDLFTYVSDEWLESSKWSED